jgi:hypothetical protein
MTAFRLSLGSLVTAAFILLTLRIRSIRWKGLNTYRLLNFRGPHGAQVEGLVAASLADVEVRMEDAGVHGLHLVTPADPVGGGPKPHNEDRGERD